MMKITHFLILILALIPLGSCSIGGDSKSNTTTVSSVSFSGATSVSNETSSTLTVNWTHVDGAAVYLVFSVSGGVLTYLASVEAPTASATLNGLAAGTTYSLRVKMVDTTGVMDDNANDISGTTSLTEVPESIGSLVGWYKSTDLNGNGDNNSGWTASDPVATWVDSSSSNNNLTQGVLANRPTYQTSVVNGLSAVRFDGATQYLTASLGALNAPITVAIVSYFAQANQPAGDFDYIFNLGTAGGANTSLSIAKSGNGWVSGTDVYYNYDGAATFVGPTMNGQTWEIHIVTHDTAATFHSYYMNGTAQGVADTSGAVATDGTLDIGRFIGNNHYLNGDIADFMVFSKVLSTTERQQLECYLATKFNITVATSCN